MIAGQALAMAEVTLSPMAILAAIAIASKEECVGDLTTKAAGNVHELDETNDCGFGKCQSFASDHITRVRFDDLGFALYHEAKGSPERDHGQWLERGVQRQTPHCAVS
jgi:hypothetical protein